MSADNWAMCPRCEKAAEAAKNRAAADAEAAYGKIPAADYEALRTIAANPPGLATSLREDYELGITHEAKFYVEYSGRCETEGCGFFHKFSHEEMTS